MKTLKDKQKRKYENPKQEKLFPVTRNRKLSNTILSTQVLSVNNP